MNVPPSTRRAPPRPAVTWLATVTVPVAVSEPPVTLRAPFELLVPRPMVPTVTVPPLTMKPELKSGAAALLRRMLTSVAVNVPPLIRNVLPESEFVRTAPNDAVPESPAKLACGSNRSSVIPLQPTCCGSMMLSRTSMDLPSMTVIILCG